MCDKLTGEITKLRKEAFELKQELKIVQRKQSQSVWYEKSKQKKSKSEGKKRDKVLNTDGSDKVINTDSTDNNSASVTLPSMFNRLKEQTTTHPSAQSVPEVS